MKGAVAVVLMCIRTATSFPGSSFLHMPKPQLVCVPSKIGSDCSELELINLQAIPEEKRVIFLFSKLAQNKATPVLRYEPTENWQCHFGERDATPIQGIHPQAVSTKWTMSEFHKYNHLSLAQCELPASALGPLLNDKALDIAVTLGAKGRVKYSLHIQRWKRKKILGMCLR